MNWRDRLQESLVEDPAYIGLTMRWLGWLIALGIILVEAYPRAYRSDNYLVLGVTFMQLFLMTFYRRTLKMRGPSFHKVHRHPGLPALDVLIALWSIYQTGGWGSPFYHFSFTCVLGPSLRYGLGAAIPVSLLYAAGYLVAVGVTEAGFSPAYTVGGEATSSLLTTPLNPILTGLYAAFLSELLQKLRKERARAEELAAAQERARLARDMHDGVSQTLFMLTMSLESGLVMAQKESAEKTARHLESLTPIAQKALLELRNAMHNVEPLATGEQTLGQACEQLARDYQSATGQLIKVIESPNFADPGDRASGVFRMIQEALANACQHSGGTEVEILLSGSTVCIKDNGEGFDPETISKGRGLKNLVERAAEMALRYQLSSEDRGTTVTIGWEERE